MQNDRVEHGDGKVLHLEAARGIAAGVVVLFHFLQFFSGALLGGRDPGDIALFNGNFAVSFFFVLSAYALSFRGGDEQPAGRWAAAAFKRYPRLAVPVLASVILAMLLAALPMGSVREIVSQHGPDASRDFFVVANDPLLAVYQGLATPFVFGYSAVNPVLWSMKVELIGSLGVFLTCWLIDRFRAWRWWLYAAQILAIGAFASPYYLAFVFGVMLHERQLQPLGLSPRWRRAACVGAFAVAIVLSAFPVRGLPDPASLLYGPRSPIWAMLPAVADPFAFWRVIGASILLWVVLAAPGVRSVFSGSLSAWLGRLSFPVYLIHWPVLTTVGLYTTVKASSLGVVPAILIAFAVVCVVTVVLSVPFWRWVDRPAVALANRCFERRRR